MARENRMSRIWPEPWWKRPFFRYTYHRNRAWISDGKGGSRPQVTREFRWGSWVLGLLLVPVLAWLVAVAVIIVVGLAFLFHLLHF